MRACHAMNRNVATLQNVMPNLVERGNESLVSVWYMTEVAFNPLGCRGYVECERVRAIVGDMSGVVAVA